MHVTIEMRRPGETTWDFVANFSASKDELNELQQLLEGREDACEVLDKVTNRLMFDVLQIVRADGYQARVQFHEEH